MKGLLRSGESVVAEGGYKDNNFMLGADVVGEYQTLLATDRAQQETGNRCFKQFLFWTIFFDAMSLYLLFVFTRLPMLRNSRSNAVVLYFRCSK